MEEKPGSLPLRQAMRILFETYKPPDTDVVPFTESLYRVAADDIISPEDFPPFERSPYDGFAFRASDTLGADKASPFKLYVTEEIRAGHMPKGSINKGQAAKILTGALLPKGADAIAKYEDVCCERDSICLYKVYSKNENVIPAGNDIKKDEMIAEKGAVITAPILSMLATLGISEVPVYSRPRVTIISTGDELIEPSQPIKEGKIRNSSWLYIKARLNGAGADVSYAGIAPDKTDKTAEMISAALTGSDMVLTTGGVSAGDYDLIRPALKLLGARILFRKVSIHPGGSVTAAHLNDKLILGLPGTPAAAAVTLHLLGLPYVRALGGQKNDMLAGESIKVRLMEDFVKPAGKGRFFWGKLVIHDGEAFIRRTGYQGLKSIYGADLLGEIGEGMPALPRGTLINAYRID